MAVNIGARKSSMPRVVSSYPSWNWTPGCSSPVPYPVTYELSISQNVSPNVRYNGNYAFIMDSHSSKVEGDKAGKNGGVMSGTVSAEAEPIEHSDSVKVNSRQAVRCGDRFYMNHKNTQGVLVCSAPPVKGMISDKGKIVTAKQNDTIPKEKKDSVNHAVKNLKSKLNEKSKALKKWDDKIKKSTKKWFGKADKATQQTLIKRIEKIQSKLDTYTVDNFKLANSQNKKLYAYVYPTDDTQIYLGKAFFKASPTGIDSQMGTVAHEMSHFNTIAGTQDHVYGVINAQKLAIKNPAMALDNADNFEYFIEE